MQKTIYFGKSCSGKTTRLKELNCVELDRCVWYYVANPNKEVWAKAIKEAILYKDEHLYVLMIRIIGRNLDWNRLFESGTQFDIPVVGIYWEFIPEYIKTSARFVKISTSDENRAVFAAARGKDANFLDCVDHFYKDPPIWHDHWKVEVYDPCKGCEEGNCGFCRENEE